MGAAEGRRPLEQIYLAADLLRDSHANSAGEALEKVRGEALHSPRLATEAVREFVVVHLSHLAEEAVQLTTPLEYRISRGTVY